MRGSGNPFVVVAKWCEVWRLDIGIGSLCVIQILLLDCGDLLATSLQLAIHQRDRRPAYDYGDVG